MGMFNFFKKGNKPAENKGKLVAEYKAREETPIKEENSSRVVNIISTDCAYDAKNKKFVYSTGIIPYIKPGFIMSIDTLDSIKELNYSMISPAKIDHNHVGELFIELKHNSPRFGKQPYQAGEVIATYSIVYISA